MARADAARASAGVWRRYGRPQKRPRGAQSRVAILGERAMEPIALAEKAAAKVTAKLGVKARSVPRAQRTAAMRGRATNGGARGKSCARGRGRGVEGGEAGEKRGERERSLCIVCEPDGGEVAPAELADDDIASVGEGVADVYGVVPALDIVLPVLLVLGHDRMRVRRVVGARV